MNKVSLLIVFLIGITCITATTYFSEDFDNGWESRWVISKVKEQDGTLGEWNHTAGRYFNDAQKDLGIQTSEDARFYQISAKFPKFSNAGKDLVIQYSVKFDQVIDCGGAYIKLLPPGLDQSRFEGESAYNIMFGPDVCGSTRKTHAILTYKGTNHLVKRNVYPETDQYASHLYTLVIRPDQTYEILIDGVSKQNGSITEDFDVLAPRRIPDPAVSKPADWVDQARIADPDAKKPEGYDSIPKEIADPDAKQPEDWDDELDGEWEAPQIPNPEYKGEWSAPLIDNPAYKGEWVHPEIENPDFVDDANIYAFEHEFLGIEIWQVKAGSIFDHILVTDSVEEAQAFATGYFAQQQAGEKTAKEADEQAAKDAAAAEAPEVATDAAPADDDDDDNHDEL
eukprot:TRINITY_DN207_c0_g1_i1.p1 TRINITY_DN207_c0_g1~~TRINITY_DN207_c0_g1_i1.p1  ORF type:complete len:396 (-),score=119.38 TRINITY_DN207_c0_g1_i1:156-1343(-)